MRLVIDYIKKDGSKGHIQSILAGFELFESKESFSQGIDSVDGVHVDIATVNGRLTGSIKANAEITLKRAAIECPFKYDSSDKLFVNGYQCWTESKEYLCQEAIHNMNKIPLPVKKAFHFEEYGDPWFLKYDKDVIHGFTYSYIAGATGESYLIGSLNEENAYLIIKHRPSASLLTVESDCAGRRIKEQFKLFDFVRLSGDKIKIQREYFASFGSCSAKPVRGYTSWYKYYQDIDEEKILAALEGIDSENYDVFQIDDGFETFVGDWLDIDEKKFPNGLTDIVDKVHSKGLKAGIWLAPFVAEKKSRLFNEHPDWFLGRNEKIVFAGCNWSGDAVLDVRKEEVKNYVKSVLKYYKDMKFDLFKLDFLYAAALCAGDSRRMGEDSFGDKTRAEIMREAMKLLREELPDKLILGCGVPTSSAFNLVDYCRVGPDMSLNLDDAFYMRPMHRERVSTKVTLQNSIYRSCMDGYVFRCDPDVYLLRDEKNKLSLEQKEALIKIDHLCGAVHFTSDDVSGYDQAKKNMLMEAKELANAKIISIEREQSLIRIGYRLNGEKKSLTYDTLKGVLING